MTVIDLKTMREVSKPPVSVVCLGNFDGVHIGHTALIQEALTQKKRLSERYTDVSCGMCFFRTPPSNYLLPSPTPQLTTLAQKLNLFASLDVDYAFIIDFEEVGGFTPEQFVSDILVEGTGCIHAVCGFNFRFGNKAVGTPEQLKTLLNGAVSILDAVQVDGKTVCSSTIRQLIHDGNMQSVIPLLGRPYCIEAEVIHGKALGRTIGVPTVNQYFPGNLAIPKYGIYITQTRINGNVYPSVTNVGIRPSVNDGTHVNCETHILGFEQDVYGKTATVSFLNRLRDEMKFQSIDALREQIQKDISATAAYFKEAPFL